MSPTASAKPKTNVDAGAARDARVDSSRRDVSAARSKPATDYRPRSSYTTASGQTRPINANDASVRRVRENYSYDRYSSRSSRAREQFGTSYSSTTVIQTGGSSGFSDTLNGVFLGYMLSNAMQPHYRAEWMYHHQSEIDSAKMAELRAKDAVLDAKIKELEAKNVARDAGYTPPGIDPDLQYSDEYVKAATGVEDAEREVKLAEARLKDAEREADKAAAGYSYKSSSASSFSFFGFLWGLIKWTFILGFLAFAVWAVIAAVKYASQK